MKERIKKFCKENETALMVAAVAAGTIAGSLVVMNNIITGREVMGLAKHTLDDGGLCVHVSYRNGFAEAFSWKPDTE